MEAEVETGAQERANRQETIMHNKWVFAYLQCTINVIRLLTDGGTPFEATQWNASTIK